LIVPNKAFFNRAYLQVCTTLKQSFETACFLTREFSLVFLYLLFIR
jgi:hypothetical protein